MLICLLSTLRRVVSYFRCWVNMVGGNSSQAFSAESVIMACCSCQLPQIDTLKALCMCGDFHFDVQLQIQSVTWCFQKQKLMSIDMYHFIFEMLLQFWVTQYFRKNNILNNHNTILICNKKNYQSSISILWSHVFPSVEDGSRIHCIHFKPTQRDLQVAFDCIFFGKSSFTNSYTWWNEYICCQSCISLGQFVCQSKLRPHMRQTSNIVLFSHSCWSVAINYRIFPCTCYFLIQCIETSTISFRATIQYLWLSHHHYLVNYKGWKI